MDFGNIGGGIWMRVKEFEKSWGGVSKQDPRADPRSVTILVSSGSLKEFRVQERIS